MLNVREGTAPQLRHVAVMAVHKLVVVAVMVVVVGALGGFLLA
jgi:hypothetical protein